MRALGSATLGTGLNDDCRRRLVRVAGALLSLGGSSLWDGHGTVSGGGEFLTSSLLRGLFHLTEGVPSRVGFLMTAIVRSGVEIRAASRTHAFAVLSAQRETWCGKQPLLADRQPQ